MKGAYLKEALVFKATNETGQQRNEQDEGEREKKESLKRRLPT